MKIINNEDYYKLKCISWFLDNGLILYGNQAIPSEYLPITFVRLNERTKRMLIKTNSFEELFKRKEEVCRNVKHLLAEADKNNLESEVN